MEQFDTNYVVVDNNNTLDSKVVFGKLMVAIRTSNEIVLTSILGNIAKTSADNRYLYLYTEDEVIFKTLSKKQNIDILNSSLKKFTYLEVKPEFIKQSEKFDLGKLLEEKFKGYFKR